MCGCALACAGSKGNTLARAVSERSLETGQIQIEYVQATAHCHWPLLSCSGPLVPNSVCARVCVCMCVWHA